MPSAPETRYAKSGDVSIAYQIVGDGPIDLVLVPGFVSHLDVDWDDVAHAHFLRRLASFSRLIRFDKRGTGLSDRPGGLPDLVRAGEDGQARPPFTGRHDDGRVARELVGRSPRRLPSPRRSSLKSSRGTDLSSSPRQG